MLALDQWCSGGGEPSNPRPKPKAKGKAKAKAKAAAGGVEQVTPKSPEDMKTEIGLVLTYTLFVLESIATDQEKVCPS